jgi:peptide/nickel transport system substrate-binding protein
VQILTQEGLLSVSAEGRPIPWLVESWTVSEDGLEWTFKLKPGVTFHGGTPLTADLVRGLIEQELPETLGAGFQNIRSVDVLSQTDFVVRLEHRSMFLPEALAANVPIHAQLPTDGTGPFVLTRQENASAELQANHRYHEGQPLIKRILIEPYASVRSAWADMLRGRLDMVYEVGVDAFDSVKPATETKVFAYRRPYAYVIVFNARTPALQNPEFRRALNKSINRDTLLQQTLDGHGRIAKGPTWPDHWTYDSSLPSFDYDPQVIAGRGPRPTFTCLYSEPSHEKLALFVRQQLQAVGVDMRLEFTSVADGKARAASGNFDAWLVDMNLAPNFFRQSLFWHSNSPFNLGRYHSARVDTALDAMDQARSDAEYKAGAAAFQRAMIDDPPGLFLAWSDRLRAVSSRFDVHVEPGRDILLTMRSWRPAMDSRTSNQN